MILDLGKPVPSWGLQELPSPARPIVLAARDTSGDRAVASCLLPALLRYPMPVTGVVAGKVGGWAAALLLSCDLLLMAPRSTLSLEPSGLGEVALLALRVGQAEASRVWFSGGDLRASRAARSGWAQLAPEGFDGALERALVRYEGLSLEAVGLLRPLLYREAGLPLDLALALERAAFALAFETGHPAEGIAAFMEKRKARYHGPRR